MAARQVVRKAKKFAQWTHRLGKVTKRNDAWKAVCVEVPDLEMDEYYGVVSQFLLLSPTLPVTFPTIFELSNHG